MAPPRSASRTMPASPRPRPRSPAARRRPRRTAAGGVADEGADVEALGRRVDGGQVLGEGLEAPVDAAVERLHRHALDVLERAHDRVAVLGPGGRDAEPAVAHDDARHPVPARRGEVAVPEDLGVVVGVDVDEARGPGPGRRGRPPRCRATGTSSPGGATAAMRSPSTATSAARAGAPVPSITEAWRRAAGPSRVAPSPSVAARTQWKRAFGRPSCDDRGMRGRPVDVQAGALRRRPVGRRPPDTCAGGLALDRGGRRRGAPGHRRRHRPGRRRGPRPRSTTAPGPAWRPTSAPTCWPRRRPAAQARGRHRRRDRRRDGLRHQPGDRVPDRPGRPGVRPLRRADPHLRLRAPGRHRPTAPAW